MRVECGLEITRIFFNNFLFQVKIIIAEFHFDLERDFADLTAKNPVARFGKIRKNPAGIPVKQ